MSSAYFRSKWIPYVLIAPQLIITFVFFIFPAGTALKNAFYYGDAFGIHSQFAGLGNFLAILLDRHYIQALQATAIFSVMVTLIALFTGLLFAVLVDRCQKGKSAYKTLLIWPYAVAPAVAGMLWRFLFEPSVGLFAYGLKKYGFHWDYSLNHHQAIFLVVIASVWQQFSYNFLFFIAGLQAIPPSLLEAAAIDGSGPFRRFWDITFPLLSPTTFFLMVINLIYSFFDTFGIIDTMTHGGPQQATNILVYKVYHDGFVGLDLGASSAQSVILMVFITILIIIQFRYIERRVHY